MSRRGIDADKNRKIIHKLFNKAGISVGTPRYMDFVRFLEDPTNNYYLQLFFVLCSGQYKFPEAHHKICDMVKELEFQQHSYSYGQLFRINQEWYDFFKENAYPTGQRRCAKDCRRGVDRDYVDDVSILNSRLKLSIDESIRWITQIKVKMLTALHLHTNQSSEPDASPESALATEPATEPATEHTSNSIPVPIPIPIPIPSPELNMAYSLS